MPPIVRHLTLLMVWCIPATGCTSWQRQPIVDGTAPAITGKYPVRVYRHDQRTIILRQVVVQGDSLVGIGGNKPHRIAVAVRDVRRIEEQRPSGLRTAAVVVVVVVGVAFVAVAAAIASAPTGF